MQETAIDNFRRLVGRYIDQLEYIRNLSEEAPFFPQHVHIEPTNACNLNCIHCIQEAMTRPRGVMPWEIYTKVIDEIAPLGCAITLDVQGEPLLHRRIVEMVAYAKRSGIHVSLLTNGLRLKPELAERLIDLKLDRVVFSFEGLSRETYEAIRIKGDYGKTLRQILHFIRINHERGHHTHVCISAVMSEAMMPHGRAFEESFGRLPVDKIFLQPLLNMLGEAGTAGQIDLAALQAARPKNEWPVCRVPWEDITVNWDGDVCLCPVDFNLNWSIGHVRESSLQELWNNERSRAFRAAHLAHAYEGVEGKGRICSQCNCLWQEEYDIRRDYSRYIREAIVRQARHFAGSLADRTPADRDEKYRNLLERIAELEADGKASAGLPGGERCGS